jgi:hypothetical protein
MAMAAITANAIIYVKHNATGSNDGTSWNNAYTTIKAALTAANDGAEIYVVSGSYPITASLAQKSVKIYGGFAGANDNYPPPSPKVG